MLLPGRASAQCAGDCNGNRQVTIDELVRGVAIALANASLASCAAVDRNGDGRVTIDELVGAVGNALGGCPTGVSTPTPVRTPAATPTLGAMASLIGTSPAHGEGGIAISRETILRFDAPLDRASVTDETVFAAFGSKRFGELHVSADGRSVTLFYLYPFLPSSARIRVTVDGERLRDAAGRKVDADGDGVPGGVGVIEFDTLSLTTIPGTSVCGRVFASELATTPGGQSVNRPLAGVRVTVDGAEETMQAVTDEFGDFRLEPAPAGRFFVHIDGRLAQGSDPQGSFYPRVGKAWDSVPGEETNIGEVYLPLITAGTLQPVSETEDTEVTFPASVLEQHPELEGVRITIPPGALISETGATGGMVGIAPVPPDRLPGPPPQGIDFPLVITVQSDRATNFDALVAVCFPNLPLPQTGQALAPGEKTGLWSFNHDAGDWELRGTMTVTADGRLVCSDPGVGIEAPGWHGINNTSPGDSTPQPSESPTPSPSPEPPKTQKPPAQPCGCDPDCPTPSPAPDNGEDADPVYLFSGEFYESIEDLRIRGRGFDFVWNRKYRSRLGPNTAQGNGWDFSYNIFMEKKGADLVVCDGNSRRDVFQLGGGIRYAAAGRAASAGAGAGVVAARNGWERREFFRTIDCACSGAQCLNLCGGDGATMPDPMPSPDPNLRMTFEDGGFWEYHPFNGRPEEGKIRRSVDRHGNQMRFEYDAGGRLVRIIDTLGRTITVAYNAQGLISSITDFIGRRVRYTYYGANEAGGSPGDLRTVTTVAVTGTPNGNDFPDGKTWTYTYTKGFADPRLNHNLLTITDPKGQTYLRNTYAATIDPNDPNFDRIVRQVWGNPTDTIDFTYFPQVPSPENRQATTKTIVRDRVGNVREYFFNGRNLLVRKLDYTGRADPTRPTTETANRPQNRLRATDPEFFETTYEYNADSLLTREVHPNGNVTEHVYEADLDPGAPARTRANLRVVRRLPGSHTPAGDQGMLVESFEYDPRFGGQEFITRHTDPRGNVTTHEFNEHGFRVRTVHRIPEIVENFECNEFGQPTSHTWPDNGSGERRRDEFVYYDSGPQRGYRRAETTDADNLRLTSTFEYDAVGNLLRHVDPRGFDTTFIVNQRDQIVRKISPQVTAESGIRYQVDFFYDANDNLVRTDVQNVDADGQVGTNTHFTSTTEYEILNFPVRMTDEVDAERSVVVEWSYDGNRNRTEIRSGEAVAGRQSANVVRIEPDERDLPFQVVRAPGTAIQSSDEASYDPNGNPVLIRRGLEDVPRVWTHTYDGYDRRVATLDPMGNLRRFSYDANGNRLGERVDGELLDVPGSAANTRLQEVRTAYDAMDRPVSVDRLFFDPATQAPIGAGSSVLRLDYNGVGEVVRSTNANGHATTMTYDTANRLAAVTDAAGNVSRYGYDAGSNPTSRLDEEREDAGGAVETFLTTTEFDGLERAFRITDSAGNQVLVRHDSRNNPVRFTDARGNVTRTVFDGLNRPIEVLREVTATGEGGSPATGVLRTRNVWDDNSRLVARIDGNDRAVSFEFDELDRALATVLADGTRHVATYDVHGNRIAGADPTGTVVQSTYDLLNRLARHDVMPGEGVAATTTFEEFRYDGLSRIVSAENDHSLVLRTHDSLFHLTSETLHGRTARWTYDAAGNLREVHYPGGRRVERSYDSLERLKTVADAGNVFASYAYVGPRRLRRREYGNGTSTIYTHDAARRLARLTHSGPGAALLEDRQYSWNAMYGKTAEVDLRSGLARSFDYDSIDRLVRSVTTPEGGSPSAVTYAWDGAHNRTSVTGGGDAGDYEVSAVNTYPATPFDVRDYDDNGSLLRRDEGGSESLLLYDFADRMVRFSSGGAVEDYRYDALGRRIERRAGDETVRYLYQGFEVLEEQGETGDTIATYVLGRDLDDTIQRQSQGQDWFYHEDQLGSAIAMTGGAGAVAERYRYDDFGVPTLLSPAGGVRARSAIGNPLLFNRQRFDDGSGFHFYKTRYLDSRAGRFTTRDTIGLWGDPRNLGNGYAYVANNPLTYVDPMGEEGKAACKDCPKEVGLLLIGSPKDEAFGDLPAGVPGHLTVLVHGSRKSGMAYHDGRGKTAVDNVLDDYLLAQEIQKHKDWKPGTPIFLVSCRAGLQRFGRRAFAQKLANRLGVNVIAADTTVRIFPDGRTQAKSYETMPFDLPAGSGNWWEFSPGSDVPESMGSGVIDPATLKRKEK